MSLVVKRLQITGLHGRQDVEIDFHNSISIFMGPNGIGKSTILNIFVRLLSRQWQRLAKQPFKSVSVEFVSGDSATVLQSECLDFNLGEMSPRLQVLVSNLVEAGTLDGVLEGDTKIEEEVLSAESTNGIQARDLRLVRGALKQDEQTARSLGALLEASRIIRANFGARLIYLPTYRRIKQEITEVLSISAPRARRIMQMELAEAVPVAQANYTEIVKFGMDDIERLLDQSTSEVKEYSRQQINSLSTRYLTSALEEQKLEQSLYLLNPGREWPTHVGFAGWPGKR